jgi:hypothetical protein
VGHCLLTSDLNKGVSFSVNIFQNEWVIYAFYANDELEYIGVCDSTKTTLNDRMKRYQAMTGGGTNKKVADSIKEYLSNGRTVTIWPWKPDIELIIKGLKVDLVKGLENPLIHIFKPKWNIKG